MSNNNRIWKDADGKQITDSGLYAWINNMKPDHTLLVGVDSHPYGNGYKFTAVACLYQAGRGGFYYHTSVTNNSREFLKGAHAPRVRARVFYETEFALEIASAILENTGAVPVVHLDASPPENREVTSAFSDQLKGYVVASGFECVIKPWAFCASGIANKHCRPDSTMSGRRRRRIQLMEERKTLRTTEK